MSYFLSPQKLNVGELFELNGEEVRHILLSRRMKVGSTLNMQGLDGKRYKTEIKEIGKNILKLIALEEVLVPEELELKITLFQSVVSEKALDFIFQKATELGAAGITLFNSKNTATKLSASQFDAKSVRWNKILWESAKQCDRSKIPALKFLPELNEILLAASNYDQVIILDASGANLQSSIFNPKSITTLALAIGPEGGFTQEELHQLESLPNSTISLISPFTLRAETAAIAGLSIIQSLI
jgi:16S rRNA (uracil1498-N3)-methyltransferase